MAQNHGIKALHPSDDVHVLGQVSARSATAALLDVWNDSTGTALILRLLAGGQLQLKDGTVGIPVIAPISDLDTGLYFPAVAELAVAIAGAQALHLDASNLTSKVRQLVHVGTAALPGVAFDGDPDTGIYRIGADQMGLAAAGALVAKIVDNALRVSGAQGVVERHDNGASGGVDWDDGNGQRIQLTANTTITETGGIAGGHYTLEVEQDGTGGWTVTWPATFKGKDGGAIPQPDTTANRTTVYSLYYNGTSYAVAEAGSWDL